MRWTFLLLFRISFPSSSTQLNSYVMFINDENLYLLVLICHTNIVTSIHESWFCARCLNTSKPSGEGAIVMKTASFLLVGMYDGSIGAASRAMVAVDQFALQLTRKHH
ncbi:hypothetical protein MKW94_005353 [Papaver nudicaule]|uniref:Secreted protein n=1 Tax=Papaver nudicaule TaxID=74823 RepID=A0AA42AW81_PAPNU|nr:hypothetical protein [Papaver nudicaule]